MGVARLAPPYGLPVALTAGKAITAVALVSVLVWTALTLRLFVWPPTPEPGRSDAVAVLAGGDGERLDRARGLMASGVAPVLALSRGSQAPTTPVDRHCDTVRAGYAVVCFSPHEATTRGEARRLSALARARGWRSLVVVTSTFHVTRARLLMSRCYRGDLFVVDAGTRMPPGNTTLAVLHEWGGLVHAALRPGC
ncbi:MAG: YdcF family protein [Actinomycetota bacterium]|nr:YdcF family protein [Actinomycetota bacterium]